MGAKVEAERLGALGIRITEYADEHAHAAAHASAASAGNQPARLPYCIRYQGTLICVELPKLTHPPVH